MSDESKILNVVLILLIVVEIFLFNNKLSDKKNLERENLTLKEERKELDNKINELDAKEQSEGNSYKNTLESLNILLSKLEMLSIKNESDFKKMVYVLSRESGLKLRESSNKEKIIDTGTYKIYYIHYKLKGDLTSFGRFLYLINKCKKYIDTSNTFFELTQDEFKISLGYIEGRGKE